MKNRQMALVWEKNLEEQQAQQFYFKKEFQYHAIKIRDETRCIADLYIDCFLRQKK